MFFYRSGRSDLTAEKLMDGLCGLIDQRVRCNRAWGPYLSIRGRRLDWARRLVRHSFSEGGSPAAPEVRLRRACGVTSFAGGGRKAEFIY
jgi:hypothetical protein